MIYNIIINLVIVFTSFALNHDPQRCIAWKNQICLQCSQSFILNQQTHSCQKNNKNQENNNLFCKERFVLKNNECLLIGCKQEEQKKCLQCFQGFQLNTEGYCIYAHCQIIRNNICVKCKQNHIFNGRRECIYYHSHCEIINLNNTCARCRNAINVNGKCVKCQNQKEQKNCIKQACMYQSNNKCQTCNNGYDLINNECFISQCQNQVEGICHKCKMGFFVKNNFCKPISKIIPNCLQLDINKKCTTCNISYILSNNKLACIQAKKGCIYQGEQCIRCIQNYDVSEQGCKLKNCHKQNQKGDCEYCNYPHQLRNGSCEIPNCDIFDDTSCLKCNDNYRLYFQGCLELDSNCLKYFNDSSAECKLCKQDYFIQYNRCVKRDVNCIEMNKEHICLKCNRWYYLNSQHMCTIREKHCVTYVNGYCVDCRGEIIGKKCKQKYKEFQNNECYKAIADQIVEISYSSQQETQFNLQIDAEGAGWQAKQNGPHFITLKFNWQRKVCGLEIKNLKNSNITEIQVLIGQSDSCFRRSQKFLLKNKEKAGAIQVIRFNKKMQGRYMQIKFFNGTPNIKLEVYYASFQANKQIKKYSLQTQQKKINKHLCRMIKCKKQFPCRTSIESQEVIKSNILQIQSKNKQNQFILEYSIDGIRFQKITGLTSKKIQQINVQANYHFIQLQNPQQFEQWCVYFIQFEIKNKLNLQIKQKASNNQL